jgi:glycosyl transferase family 25
MHVDGAYFWLRRMYPQLTTRVAVPQLGYQRASRTDIHVLRWFDRLAGARQLTAAVRALKNRGRNR